MHAAQPHMLRTCGLHDASAESGERVAYMRGCYRTAVVLLYRCPGVQSIVLHTLMLCLRRCILSVCYWSVSICTMYTSVLYTLLDCLHGSDCHLIACTYTRLDGRGICKAFSWIAPNTVHKQMRTHLSRTVHEQTA